MTSCGEPPAVTAPPTRAWSLLVARWSQPATRQSVLSMADQAVVSGTSFVSSLLIGRECSREALGVYSLMLSLLLLARGCQGEVVSSPYLVYCHRRQGRAFASYTGSSLIHQMVISLLTLLLMAVVLLSLSVSGGAFASLLPGGWVLLAFTPLILLREHLRQLAFAELRLPVVLALDGTVAVLQIGGLLLAAASGKLTVPVVYWAMGLACVAACGAWRLAPKRPMHFDLRQAVADWRTNWQFGRWALSSHLLSRAMSYLAPWIIAAAHGEAATGLMAACVTIVNLPGMLVTGISNALTPRAAREFSRFGVSALRRVLLEAAVAYLLLTGLFCAFVALTGDWLVRMLYGSRFAGGGPVLLILGLQLLANTVGITAGNGLWAIDQPRANFVADAVTLVVTAPVLAALVFPWGVVGAAVALLLGTVAGAVVRCLMLRHQLRQLSAEDTHERV